MPRDNHAKGVLVAGAGVLAISPDSLLIRLVTVDPWTLLFWRGLLSARAILAGLAVLHRRRLPNHLLAIGGIGIWLAVLFGKINKENHMKVELAGLYWHFVDLVWVLLFTIVYLM